MQVAQIGPLVPNTPASSGLLPEMAAAMHALSGRCAPADEQALLLARCHIVDVLCNVRARAATSGYEGYLERVAHEEPPFHPPDDAQPRDRLNELRNWYALLLPDSEWDGNPLMHGEERMFARQAADMAARGCFRTKDENDGVRDLMAALQIFRCNILSNDEVRRRRVRGEFGGVGQYPPVVQHYHFAL